MLFVLLFLWNLVHDIVRHHSYDRGEDGEREGERGGEREGEIFCKYDFGVHITCIL